MPVLAVVGFASAIVFALLGLSPGGSELEQVLALASLFLAAAGVIGYVVTRREGREPRRPFPLGGVIMGVVAFPIAMVMFVVFLVTFVPSLFLMLPFVLTWAIRDESNARPPHRDFPHHAHPTFA